MITADGDLDVFLLCLFLFFLVFVLPAIAVLAMSYVTRRPPRPISMNGVDELVERERRRHA